jgi:MarR family 2-MHQ and catechol resistance regulon transcriptional repressor
MPVHFDGSREERRAADAYVKLVRCASAVASRLEEDLRARGLNESTFGALEALLHLGPLSPRELGGKLFTSNPNVTKVLDVLEKKGLIVRMRRSDSDRRRVTVQLTPAGVAEAKRAFSSHLAEIVDDLATLTPREQEELARLCKKLGRHER